jgi:hypothetical protein
MIDFLLFTFGGKSRKSKILPCAIYDSMFGRAVITLVFLSSKLEKDK